jgi:pyruvate dehydrogenase E1 component alpha subunit
MNENLKKEKEDIYYYMKLGRTMEERIEILYKQGRIPGAIYMGRGQEAITVTTSYLLKEGDVIAPTHRDLIAHLPRGMEPKRILAQCLGKRTGPTKGKDGISYMGDLKLGIFTPISMLPDGYPVVTGAALAFKLRKESRVALGYCGEGATSRGDFHESLNLASVQNLPVVFVVINNQFAYSTPVDKEMKIRDVSQRACAYDIPGISVDGNDVMAVYIVAKEAIDRARNGGGPTLIEAKTMRMRGHAGHDPAKYVPKELLDEWEKKDPIKRFEKHLIQENIIDESKMKEIGHRVEAEIEEALKFAEESPFPEGHETLEGVYA